MFYFAWVDPTDTEFDIAFARNDEDILSLKVDHDEAGAAGLTIEIKNPRIGLLHPTRKRWAWLSWDGETGVDPLFFGKLVGVPDRAKDEVIRLTLVAIPLDFVAQKEAVADALRVLPWFDPVWIAADRRADPDLVLEARTSHWHIDRITHVVTASDIAVGEAGTIDIGGDFFRDSLDLRYTQMPARKVRVSAEMSWAQVADGEVDITRTLTDAFVAVGTTRMNTVSSYTGEGLVRDWPQPGTRIEGGWSVGSVRLDRIDGVRVPSSGMIANTPSTSRIYFPLWVIQPNMTLRYDVSRSRVEGVTFTLEANTQALITEPDEDDIIDISLQSSAASQAIDGALPIGDVRRRSYFQTDRGLQSIENLVLRARAQLVARARAVQVVAEVPFATAVALSCRHSLTLADDRLPGGEATGKVVGYSFSANGDRGLLSGSVTIACSIGEGGTITPDAGVPGYVETGYVADGWQAYSGGEALLSSGDVALSYFGGVPIADDGISFPIVDVGQAVLSCTVANGQTAQEAKLAERTAGAAASATALNTVPTTIELELASIDRLSFRTDYALTLSMLAIPKTIDLGAA
ncbi:MAG: hypothetical protein V4747_11495 [Pseudomonadota bacterium]